MIITKKKNLDAIVKNLERRKTVYLFGCNSCAEQCSTGGEKEVSEMKGALEKRGFAVAGSSLPDETCYGQIVKKEFRINDSLKNAEAILVLACGAGVKTVADNAPEEQAVFPALDTVFLATVERMGRFFEGCRLCGDCVLDRTAGVCPHTECPKGMLNGPCGGMANGMCEVGAEKQCAWARIYGRLKKQNRLYLLRTFNHPKDHSVLARPRNLLLR
jgi:ferredoxin